MGKSIPLEERFWSKVNKHSGHFWNDSECWEWIGFRVPDGYGELWFNETYVGAHRISYMMAHRYKKLPKHWVLHKCNNPPCVNPAHLYKGNAKTNAKYRYECGRGRDISGANNPMNMYPEIRMCGDDNPSRKHPETRPRGSKHGRTFFDEADIVKIRKIYAAGGITYSQLARDYSRIKKRNVLPDSIEQIVKRTSWQHVS